MYTEYLILKHYIFIIFLCFSCNLIAMEQPQAAIKTYLQKNRLKNYRGAGSYLSRRFFTHENKPTAPLLISHNADNTLFACYTQEHIVNALRTNDYLEYNVLTETDLDYEIERRFEPIDELNKENIIVSLVAKYNDHYIVGCVEKEKEISTLKIYTKQNNFFTSPTLILKKQFKFLLNSDDFLEKMFITNENWLIITNKGAILTDATNTILNTNQYKNPSYISMPIYKPKEKVFATDYNAATKQVAFGLLGKIQIASITIPCPNRDPNYFDVNPHGVKTIEINELKESEINVISLSNTEVACATKPFLYYHKDVSGRCDTCKIQKQHALTTDLYSLPKPYIHNQEMQKNEQSLFVYTITDGLQKTHYIGNEIRNIMYLYNDLHYSMINPHDSQLKINKITDTTTMDTIYTHYIKHVDYTVLTPTQNICLMTTETITESPKVIPKLIVDIIIIENNRQNDNNDTSKINPPCYHLYRMCFQIYHSALPIIFKITLFSVMAFCWTVYGIIIFKNPNIYTFGGGLVLLSMSLFTIIDPQ